LGSFLAEMDLEFQKINNYTIKSRQFEWDIQYLDLNKRFISDIPEAKDRKIVKYFFQQFEENVRPLYPTLRKQIIHNDANEWNVITQDGRVSGIIDFGDIAHSFLINELAIAITYSCYNKKKPLYWASIIVESYHKKLPLNENELQVLYYLIAARLCISVCNSAHSKILSPDNSYTSVSENSAWSLLYHWLEINPVQAENEFRKAVGLKPKQVIPIKKNIERRHKHISSTFSLSYNEPIQMVRSAFQYMYDAHGNTFLDAYNNIPHVGHSHPKIVAAGQRQMATLNTNTRYIYDQLPAYAEKLIEKFPPSLNKVFLVNSGSAASDLALRLARFFTGHKRTMVMELGYHGNTQTSIEISDYKFNNPKGQGQREYILKTPIPDIYKGKYSGNINNAGKLLGL